LQPTRRRQRTWVSMGMRIPVLRKYDADSGDSRILRRPPDSIPANDDRAHRHRPSRHPRALPALEAVWGGSSARRGAGRHLATSLSAPVGRARTVQWLMARASAEPALRTIAATTSAQALGTEVRAHGGVLRYAARALGAPERAWLAALPPPVGRRQVLLCHGTPATPGVYFMETVTAGFRVDVSLGARPATPRAELSARAADTPSPRDSRSGLARGAGPVRPHGKSNADGRARRARGSSIIPAAGACQAYADVPPCAVIQTLADCPLGGWPKRSPRRPARWQLLRRRPTTGRSRSRGPRPRIARLGRLAGPGRRGPDEASA